MSVGSTGGDRSCAWPHWPELGLPGLGCLCFSPPGASGSSRPTSSQSRPICDARPCRGQPLFRGKHGPTGGPTRPVTALKVGARRPTRNGMEGKQLRTQFGLVRRLAGYKGHCEGCPAAERDPFQFPLNGTCLPLIRWGGP